MRRKQQTELEVGIARYIKDQEHRWASATLHENTVRLARFAASMGSQTVTAKAVCSYLRELKQDLREQTVGFHQRTIKAYLKWAALNGYEQRGIADNVHVRCRNSPLKRETVTNKEFDKILEATEELFPTLVGPMKMAYWTGLRASDVWRLKPEHVDVSIPCITIVPLKTKRLGTQVTIPFEWGTQLGDLIEELLKVTSSGQTFFPFPSKGTARPTNSFHRKMKKIQEKAGVRRFTFHSLRRTFISNIMNSGASPQIAGAVVGIRSPVVLARYAVPQMDGLQEMMETARKYTTRKDRTWNRRQ